MVSPISFQGVHRNKQSEPTLTFGKNSKSPNKQAVPLNNSKLKDRIEHQSQLLQELGLGSVTGKYIRK